MAFKEVSRVEVTEIVRRGQAGESIRHLAKAPGLSRNTVAKYVQVAESSGLTRDGPPPTVNETLALVPLNAAGPRQVGRPTEEEFRPWAGRICAGVQKG